MEMRLDAIGIVVKSIERSVEFYRLLSVPFADPGDSPTTRRLCPAACG